MKRKNLFFIILLILIFTFASSVFAANYFEFYNYSYGYVVDLPNSVKKDFLDDNFSKIVAPNKDENYVLTINVEDIDLLLSDNIKAKYKEKDISLGKKPLDETFNDLSYVEKNADKIIKTNVSNAKTTKVSEVKLSGKKAYEIKYDLYETSQNLVDGTLTMTENKISEGVIYFTIYKAEAFFLTFNQTDSSSGKITNIASVKQIVKSFKFKGENIVPIIVIAGFCLFLFIVLAYFLLVGTNKDTKYSYKFVVEDANKPSKESSSNRHRDENDFYEFEDEIDFTTGTIMNLNDLREKPKTKNDITMPVAALKYEENNLDKEINEAINNENATLILDTKSFNEAVKSKNIEEVDDNLNNQEISNLDQDIKPNVETKDDLISEEVIVPIREDINDTSQIDKEIDDLVISNDAIEFADYEKEDEELKEINDEKIILNYTIDENSMSLVAKMMQEDKALNTKEDDKLKIRKQSDSLRKKASKKKEFSPFEPSYVKRKIYKKNVKILFKSKITKLNSFKK